MGHVSITFAKSELWFIEDAAVLWHLNTATTITEHKQLNNWKYHTSDCRIGLMINSLSADYQKINNTATTKRDSILHTLRLTNYETDILPIFHLQKYE